MPSAKYSNQPARNMLRDLGMVNYFAKFIPLMSLITDPIRKVMKTDVELKWTNKKKRQIKEILTAAPVPHVLRR